MSWYTYNQAGVLIEKGDDASQTVTDYDQNGVQVSTRPYSAAEIAQAELNAAMQTAASNLATLQSKAQVALDNNATYLGIPSPTNAQAVAQVGKLTRQVDALIRVVNGLLTTITDS